MHILEIPSFFPPCGGLFCLDQAKALANLGHEVRILSNVQLGLTVNTKLFFTYPIGRYEHVQDGIPVIQSYQRGIPKAIHYNVQHWVYVVCSMFADYMKENRIKADSVYLSLGDKEEKTRNAVMSQVGDCIRDGYAWLKEHGIYCTLEWNKGGHFKEPELRTARAFARLLK